MAFNIALATFAVVLCGCRAADYGWQAQKELTFTVQGQDVVGLPELKPQYAGFNYHGELRVQTHTSRVLLLKFFNMSYSKIHEDLPNGWWNEPEAPSRNKTRPLKITSSTIVLKMRKSTSPELILQSGLDDWQVNFIKGLVSHLLVYLSDNSISGHYDNQITNTQTRDVYSVFEDSVSGRCEVMYEISPLPRQVAPHNQGLCNLENSEMKLWEITKTRNFSNCHVLNEDHAHLPTSDCPPGGSNCGRFWTRASLTQMIGCGDLNNLILLRSVSSSTKHAQLHLKDNSQAVARSKLNITLTSVLGLKSKFNAPQDKQTVQSLLYSYSATPKEFPSQKCQETLTYSEEDKDSHEHFDSTKQINPTEENNIKNSNSKQRQSGFRNKRSIKNRYNRYGTDSNEQPNNEISNEQPTFKKSSKHYNSGKTASKKPTYRVKSVEDSDSGNNRFISEEQNNQRPKNTNKNQHSEESNDGGNNRFSSEEQNNQRPKNTNKNQHSEESNDGGNNRFSSEEQNNQRPKNTNKNQHSEESNDQSSEESNNQHSEEMDLEELWKISGKDTKKDAPHQPFNMFSLAHRESYDPPCLSTKLRQLVGDIASDLKEINIFPEKNTLDKLSTAVDICRSLPLDQLSAVSEEVFEIHNGASNAMKNDERKVFRDVMTICGSHPAFQVIKGWIERQQMEGEEAAQMISSLPNHIFSPNKYLIQDYFDMVQQIAEREDQQLTTTAVLSMSNLVRSACVNQASRQHQFSSILKPVCDENHITRYVEWLSHKISSDAPMRRAYIEALGNVGSPHVIDILKSIAVNPKYSSYYRTSAIFAMRYQVLKKNPEMSTLLMSLYHNYSLPASARIASVALMVYADPGLKVWQRLAISTWYEPSSAVAQFVSSSIHNIARSKDSLYSHMTKAATLVRPFARPSKIYSYKPFNLVTSSLSSDLEKLVLEQISWMQFSDFSNLYYRHSSRYSGFSRTNVEAGFSVSNQDELWTTLQDLIGSTDVYNIKSPNLENTHTLADIQDTLKLHTRFMPSMQAELHLKINNMMERMILINRDTIKSLAKGGHKLVSEVLKGGKSLSFQKADMDSIHISTTTEMGFPVEFSVRTPWIIRTKAELNSTNKGLALKTAFMYSAQMLSSMSLMSPWDGVQHMAGAYATNFVQLPPLRLVSSIDSASDSIKMMTDYIDQHRLLYFNMQPFTSQRKIKVHQPALLSPDTMPVKLGDSVQVPISGMGRFLNTVYSSEKREHFSALDFLKQARGVVGFPMVFVNMESRSFETVMNPLHPLTMNFSMSLASKSKGVLEYGSTKETLFTRMLYSLEKITSLGQSPFMSAFRLFGGLFGGSDDPTTTETPSAGKEGKTQYNKKDSDRRQLESNNNPTEDDSKNISDSSNSSKEGKDREETSKSNSQPKGQATTSQEQVDQVMESAPTPQVYTTTYESAVGSFNASQVDPFKNLVQGSGVSHLLDQVLSQINSGNAVVYALDVQSEVPEKPIKLSAYATHASTYSRRVNRFGVFVKKDQTERKMTVVLEDPADISSDLKRRVAEDLQYNIVVDYIHSTSNQDIKAFMKARLGVSRSELVELRSSPQLETCSHDDAVIDFKCQQLREQTKQISFGNITLHYSNDAKFLEKMVVAYINSAKVMIQGTEERSGEASNTMTLMFDVNQKTRSVDTSITTPETSVKIHRVALSKLPMSILAEWATQPDAVPEYCGVSPHRFRTFDGGESVYEMNDNWHLVLHDRTRKYGISVLAQSSNNTMKIEVNKNDQFVMRVEGPRVYVNDKLQPIDVDHALMAVTDRRGRVVMHVIHTPDNSLRIQLPYDHLDLRYTTSYVIVRAGPALHGRLCGICGSYSNTGAEQYLASQGQSATSAEEYAASFQLRAPQHSSSQQSDADN